ncbi:MAG: leucine-rich repeat domain-containing protein, partial [Bacteroidales bacterium]|nr:leucine-rich repeat domain-containing protein [Bacteroidales bacterium]
IVSIELYRGEKLVSSTLDELGTFKGLLSDNEYTLVVTYAYDLNDGLGTRTTEVSGTVSTKAKKTPTVEIYGLTSGKEDITYELAIGDEDGVGYISSLTLSRGSLSWTVDPSEYGTFTNLLSDNEYTLTVVYVYDLNDGNGEHTINVAGSVSTLAKETPEVEIYSLTSTKNSVEYGLVVNDADGVGKIVSVTLTKGNTLYTTNAGVYGSFTGLLSDNEYILKVVYEYDLNDGYGTRTFEVSGSIFTLAVAKPEVAIDSLVSSKDGIEYVLSVTDKDEVGTTVSVMLMKGNEAIGIAADIVGGFDDLLSDSEYTLNVVYTYDLCDGLGERTLEVNGTISTLAKELPSITIDSLSSTKEEIAYEYSVVDEDDVGMNVSVYLTGANGTFRDETYSGGFANLWSDNEYTLTVVYAYDLGDGAGIRTLAVSDTVYTLEKESPVAEIVFIESSTYALTFSVLYADNDDVGYITDVGLYDGSVLVTATGSAYMGEITYTGLSSYTLYTLVVSYEYNLNDGVGTRMGAVEYSYYTDPYIEFSSITVINTSAVSEGEAIVLEVDVVNPDGVEFLTVTVNGTKYDVSPVSTGTKLYIEITNEDQFAGGDTTLEITRMTGTLGGKVYGLDVNGSNTASLFVNGVLLAEDFSVVHFVDGKEEKVEYAFNSDQLYYKVELGNATGYEIFSITLGGTTYSEGDFYISDDRQTIYVSFSDGSNTGWRSKTFSSISYGNETLEFKEKIVSISTSYVRLKTDDVIEIYTADQLLEMDGWKYYKLMNDIDLSGYKKEWVNMGNNMYGVFDGNGHTISGITAVSTYSNLSLYLGLFNNVQGVIMNLDVCDVLYIVTLNSTTSSSFAVYAGGLSAQSGQVFLKNCNITSSFQITNTTGGKVYIGTLSGSVSSGSRLKQIVSEMSAVVNATDSCYDYGYFGSNVTLEISDCRCDYRLITDVEDTKYIIEGDYRFSCEDGAYELVAYLGKDTHLVLPETIDGNSYDIGKKAFYQSDIEDVVIPEGVTYIGELAFAYSNLKSVIIPGTVQDYGTESFYECTSLTYVFVCEGVTKLGDLMFYNDTRLKCIVLPSTLESVNSAAFYDCVNLEFVYYFGSEEDWNGIKISSNNNDWLESAPRYYYSELEPIDDGNYWYIVDDEIVIWTKKES